MSWYQFEKSYEACVDNFKQNIFVKHKIVQV